MFDVHPAHRITAATVVAHAGGIAVDYGVVALVAVSFVKPPPRLILSGTLTVYLHIGGNECMDRVFQFLAGKPVERRIVGKIYLSPCLRRARKSHHRHSQCFKIGIHTMHAMNSTLF